MTTKKMLGGLEFQGYRISSAQDSLYRNGQHRLAMFCEPKNTARVHEFSESYIREILQEIEMMASWGIREGRRIQSFMKAVQNPPMGPKAFMCRFNRQELEWLLDGMYAGRVTDPRPDNGPSVDVN